MNENISILIDSFAKGALILLLALVATLIMRRTSAAARHLVWTGAVAGVLILPLLSFVLPTWAVIPVSFPEKDRSQIEVAPESSLQLHSPTFAEIPAAALEIESPSGKAPASPMAEDEEALVHVRLPVEAETTGAVPGSSASSTTSSRGSVWAWLPWIWAGGILLALSPLFFGWIGLLRLRRASGKITDDDWLSLLHELRSDLKVDRKVCLLRSPRCTMPMTWGALPGFAAKLLIPEDSDEWSIDRRRVVLLHELAHIKRWDCLTQALTQLARALYWFNPLIWVAAKRMLVERERACDDLVLLRDVRPSEYARHLLEVAEGQPVKFFACHPGIAMARPSTLGSRVVAILDKKRSRWAVTRLTAGITLLIAGAAAVPVAVLKSGATRSGMDAPEFIEMNLDRSWASLSYGLPEHTAQSYFDLSGEYPVFRVDEPNRTHIWMAPNHRPVDFEQYPIVVLEYRAMGDRADEEHFLLWLDDGRGTNEIIPFEYAFDVISDGEVRELRRDIRELDPQGPIGNFALGVRSGDGGQTAFELRGLRFERDPDALKAPEPFFEGKPIVMRILDERGNPISGATVTIDAERTNFARSEETDADGFATVHPLVNGFSTHMMRIEADGYERTELIGVKHRRAGPIEVRLRKARTFSGTVTDDEGEPIPGVYVVLDLRETIERTPPEGVEAFQRVHSFRTNPVRITLLTDDHGKWESPPTLADELGIHLAHPDYVDLIRGMAWLRTEEKEIVHVMKRGTEASGRVVDSSSSAPLAGVHVRLGKSRYARESRTLLTAEDGRFRFDQVSDDDLVLTFQSASHAPELLELQPAGKRQNLTVELEPGGVLEGRLMDQDGGPLENISVSADTWRGYESLDLRTNTDADGRFRFENAPSDTIDFEIYDLEKQWMSVKDLPMTAGKEVYAIHLQPALTVQGRVIDAESKVSVKDFSVVHGFLRETRTGPGSRPYWYADMAERHQQGSFEHRFTSPKDVHLLRVEAPGYAPATSRAFDPSEGTVEYIFELEKDNGIRGSILGVDGRPVANLDVFMITRADNPTFPPTVKIKSGRIDQPRGLRRLELDAKGQFHLPPSAEQEFIIIGVSDSGYIYVTEEDVGGQKELTLQPWAGLNGLVMIGGQPNPQANVSYHHKPERDMNAPRAEFGDEAITDANGKFTMTRLPAGQGRIAKTVRAGQATWYTYGKRVDLEAGEIQEVQIGGAGRAVKGRLRMSEGADEEGAWERMQGRIMTKRKDPPYPEGWKEMTPEKQQKWFSQWQETEEGKAFQERQPQFLTFPAFVDSAGRFLVHDIPEGNYTLFAALYGPEWDGRPFGADVIASASVDFKIEEIVDDPLDLGEIELMMQQD